MSGATHEDVATALRLAKAMCSDAEGLNDSLKSQHEAASSALLALGQSDDGRPLAERIGDAHAEIMRHLNAARAEVSRLQGELYAIRGHVNASPSVAAKGKNASPRTECANCGQFYSSYGTSMIGRCAASVYDDITHPGWRDPAHKWATVVDPQADERQTDSHGNTP